MTKILVTGGAGYIGSHTVVDLLNKGYEVEVIDNLSNSNEESLRRIMKISQKNIEFHEFDLRDKEKLLSVFSNSIFSTVIHFAGLKAVGESVSNALEYYKNNLESTLTLLEVMEQFEVNKLVFSSSATIYGDPETCPIKETAPRHATNPYGQTKLMIEQILEDVALSNKKWNITSLRYFNPIGAHPSGLIGEDPKGKPNNLLPYLSQVAVGRLKKLKVFGNDYHTIDGTGVRDYIHVVDLARAHTLALENKKYKSGYVAYNVGTGNGISVLEIIKIFEGVTGKKIPYIVADRRPGDIATCYADPTKINKALGWKSEFSIEDACKHSWNWQSKNPEGYVSIGNT